MRGPMNGPPKGVGVGFTPGDDQCYRLGSDFYAPRLCFGLLGNRDR